MSLRGLIIIVVVAITLCPLSFGQSLITTVAGTDKVFPASGVKGLQVPLAPFGVSAIDSSGNFYFSDNNVDKIIKLAPGGILTAVAGNGVRGFSGDGGSALRASLALPYAIAVDHNGNLLIADLENNRVRQVDAGTGIITTIAGNGQSAPTPGGNVSALSAPFGMIAGIAVDSSNNIYLSDFSNNVILRISGGLISTYVGASAGLNQPRGLAVDASNNLFIADSGNNVVRKVTAGQVTTIAGNGVQAYNGDGIQATAASLSGATDVAVDAGGNVYICDYGNHRIRKVSGGIITTVAGTNTGPYGGFNGESGLATSTALSFPSGVSVDAAGNIFISDGNNGRIREVTGNMMTTVAGSSASNLIGDGGQATLALLNDPNSVAVDGQGNVYIADTSNHRVRKIASNGIVTTYAGVGTPGYSGDHGPATAAALNNPYGVAVDSTGNVYVADTVNSAIRKISPNGTIVTVAGTGVCGYNGDGPGSTTQLCVPSGIAVDLTGNVFVADTGNDLVRLISGNGSVTTIAGHPDNPGYFGDGGKSLGSLLYSPNGVAVDAFENVYIADTGNNAIRKIASGVISTLVNGLNGPMGVVVDGAGDVLFSDSGNRVVRMLSARGTLSIVAGTGVDGFGGDGGPANQALVSLSVNGLAIDSGGGLYFADTNNNRIRKVLASPPAVIAAPLTLSFSANSGDAPTAFQVVTLSSIPGVIYAAQASDPWIQVTPGSGLMPAPLQISVDPSTLSSGAHQGHVTISSTGGLPASLTVSVSATIGNGNPPTLSVNTPGVRFGVVQGNPPATQQFLVKNTGGGTLTFTPTITTVDGGNWLTIVSGGGSVTPAAPGTVIITASTQGLAPGTYTGAVVLTSSAGNANVPVVMTVSAAQPRILLSQTGLSFQVLQGGMTLPKSFSILNTGQGELFWTAAVTTNSGGPNWLSLDSTNGTVATPFTDVATVNVSANANGLAPGVYYGQVNVTAPGADNAPQIVSVLLTVLPAGSTLAPEVLPASLVFTGSAGQNPSSQSIQIANRSGQSLTYTSAPALADAFTIISFLPLAGTIPGGGSGNITVQPDFSQQRTGVNTSSLGIQFSDGTVQTVKILTVVASGTSSNAHATGGCSGSATANLNNSQGVIQTTPGASITISVTVTDGCGGAVTKQGGGFAILDFGNNNGTPLTNTTGGTWETSYTVPNSPGTTKVTVRAGFESGITPIFAPGLPLSITVQPAANIQPIVSEGGVVNSASFEPGPSLVSPGGYVSIFGSNLGDPTQPQATSVVLGSRSLAVQYVSPSVVNVQIPFDLPTSTDLPIWVRQGSANSNVTAVSIASAEPAIFTMNQSGSGQGAITNLANVLVDNASPAGAGDEIVIYCTGLGQVDQTLQAGQPSPVPAANTVNTPAVTIGGQPSRVIFSGLTPTAVGLYQINAFVPSGLPPGPTPVQITIAGQSTPQDKVVTMVLH